MKDSHLNVSAGLEHVTEVGELVTMLLFKWRMCADSSDATGVKPIRLAAHLFVVAQKLKAAVMFIFEIVGMLLCLDALEVRNNDLAEHDTRTV